jgi:hypothetical protein
MGFKSLMVKISSSNNQKIVFMLDGAKRAFLQIYLIKKYAHLLIDEFF